MSESRRHFRGDFPQYGRAPVSDRRRWTRREIKRTEATLSWMLGGAMTTIPARLVDISRGGAGILIQTPPPHPEPLRLALADDPSIRVDGRAVGMRPHPKPGWIFLHLQFQTECPRALLERGAVDRDHEDDDPEGSPMDDGFGLS